MQLNYLSDMNTRQVQELQKKTKFVFLPIGPTEVHSYYLPTRTDVVLAEEVSERTAKKLLDRGIETLIAPSIPYCVANGLNVFPGNTTIRPQTVSDLIADVCISLARWDFCNILVVSGHSEPLNVDAIEAGIRQAMERDSHINIRLSEWTSKGMARAEPLMKSEHPELEIHAGEHEVGLMMLRCPDLVDREALGKMEPNWADSSFWEKITDYSRNYTFPELGAPDGYFGNPRLATEETGDKVFDVVADYVVTEAMTLMGLEDDGRAQ